MRTFKLSTTCSLISQLTAAPNRSPAKAKWSNVSGAITSINFDVAVLGGLAENEISGPYPIENLRNMGPANLQTLRQVNSDAYQSYLEVKEIIRKYRLSKLATERALLEASDLLAAWRALSACPPKTVQQINQLRQSAHKKFKDLSGSKEEILGAYKEGLAALKSYELHRNLWKDAQHKEHLIDVYY